MQLSDNRIQASRCLSMENGAPPSGGYQNSANRETPEAKVPVGLVERRRLSARVNHLWQQKKRHRCEMARA